MKYKIFPDICVLGKTLGNGYAITAILGKDKIMSKANKTFISSTFWTEKLDPLQLLKQLSLCKNISHGL